MANGRNPKKRGHDSSRDAGGFVALPWAVLDSQAYLGLSSHAKALLLDVARQYARDNNGRLLCSRAHMATRGWNSSDMLTKAKRELIAAGFLYETVIGARPAKAGWYALTWFALDLHPGFDPGAAAAFKRGGYREAGPLLDRQTVQVKNARPRPSHGIEGDEIGPPHGTGEGAAVPPHGPISAVSGPRSVPWDGHHLDNHLPGEVGPTMVRRAA